MIEITAKLSSAYKRFDMGASMPIIVAALRDMTAEVMRLEFENEHRSYTTRIGVLCCQECGWEHKMKFDPRHTFQWADWRRAAHEKLMKEAK